MELGLLQSLSELGRRDFESSAYVECEAKWKEALEKLNETIKVRDDSDGWGSDESELKLIYGMKFIFMCRLSLLYKRLNRFVEANILANHSLEIAKFYLAEPTSSNGKVIRLQNPVQVRIFHALNECVYNPQDKVQVICTDFENNNNVSFSNPKIYSIKEFKEIRDKMKNKVPDPLIPSTFNKTATFKGLSMRKVRMSDGRSNISNSNSNNSISITNNNDDKIDIKQQTNVHDSVSIAEVQLQKDSLLEANKSSNRSGISNINSNNDNSNSNQSTNYKRNYRDNSCENSSSFVMTPSKKIIIHANKKPKAESK